MARKKSTTKKKVSKQSKPFTISSFKLSRLQEVIVGFFLIALGIIFLLSFTSFLLIWRSDQSILGRLTERELEAQNWLSKLGAWLGDVFIYDGFGIAAFSIAILLVITGIYLFAAKRGAFSLSRKRISLLWIWGLPLMLWLSVFFGFFHESLPLLGGMVGMELNDFMQDYIGFIGAIIVMSFLALIYLTLRLGVTPEKVSSYFKRTTAQVKEGFDPLENTEATDEETDWKTNTIEGQSNTSGVDLNDIQNTEEEDIPEPVLKTEPTKPVVTTIPASGDGDDIGMDIEQTVDEEEVFDNKASKLVQDFGEFDPTLELSNYQFPPIDLLKDYTKGKTITINEQELQANKDRIVDTLKNYKIGIAKITATVGPTVTLYEIVPEAGVRISKIKNLEDDIALSLAALGIRIIAPIPGKGTIGIEVPNQNPSIVSMRSVIASPKFQNAEMALPIAFGKTISNETFVVDLAKMPHLLMAGATGQGKSVGLNAVLTSLLYSKHPAEVKFVLVDPKKVELTLFNKIERHYLAKLPDSEEAIITDNSKVINTLNSLCIEMDQRYDILKEAMCRNIKEYNTKFKARKLNPANGHKFLPYIVLVVDEFADLIMTAGKEVETPIARLAQLARAIGIHLIIATQRPSVNVITGMIKANFPARVSFRVQQKVDSRTILDSGGADQLIGRGDMLYTSGNEIIRIQCAFVDTPEVEKITDFIGSQKAYPDAHLLPEYVGEEGGTSLDISIDERDSKFREGAEIIVIAQQGSASLLQRKLKLGYNRAGRIIDQLEAAGIVGGFEGSKARQVLVPDLAALEVLLNEEKNK
ncbi:DNA segregation ATPase FtsK/SpoIIIE, S-DNA-T family [Nonlabens sp. Hel1_33_55]|uniref:DNA translocase FtsK n=1 Tax=Nonlabens sp. Hel1_33_55 TaxID=1336802 RepID=UPI000875D9D5|nr:DNA translocase FtsK [Nonlabens sp. Hel1_33_55]SCX95091.1 DNA segregation ATPase FtsK/SpoIIIE, S-DNA-T family [Nonlabens sp. Hel1_33_55]